MNVAILHGWQQEGMTVYRRSELAREKPMDDAGNLQRCVIVDVFREQARSYRG
jgi:hypothetical protein